MENGTNAHEYVLGRNDLAASRLNLQHYLWVREVGYHLHPGIANLPLNSTIADVATGTAVWAIDMAKDLPKASFHGFDIDICQAPPKEWLPENVQLDVLDVFQPPPEHLVGKFDVVHLRLLMCVIRDDPRPVLRNLMALLKPGGYLQWGEMDPTTTRFESIKPDISCQAIEAAGAFPSTLSKEDSRMEARWVGQLASLFEQEGMLVLADEHKFREKSHLGFYTDAAFMVWEEWRSKMRPQDAESYGKIVQEAREAREACGGGLAINLEIRTVVGQKPL